MSDKDGVRTKSPKLKKKGGGKAVGGGVEFQATVTAIVAVHILRGIALEWLQGLTLDRPLALWAESEGPGDDIRIELENDHTAEIQVKKGLKRGPRLWEPLEAMAQAIQKGDLHFGILAVAPDSSDSIKNQLVEDIVRLGQGRNDSISNIGAEWEQRLAKLKLAPEHICSKLRIQVVHGLSATNTDIKFAKQILGGVCVNEIDANNAWIALFEQSVTLIRNRGRWTQGTLRNLLTSRAITIRSGEFPVAIMDRQIRWVIESSAHFAITGTRRRIALEHLLPMKLKATSFDIETCADASTSLAGYHASIEHDAYEAFFDSAWTARFRRLAVVRAGPGLGKSTMMTELAHRYAQDGFVVLSSPLKMIAAAMLAGKTFTDTLLSIALDGSGLTSEQLMKTDSATWVVLLDGLDECGSEHSMVAKQIRLFATGYQHARVVVTTRPIGYTTHELEAWPHYRLLAPDPQEGSVNLARLLKAAAGANPLSIDSDIVAKRELHQSPAREAIVTSPHLLGMAASLIMRNQALPQTRTQLYRSLIELFDAPSKVAAIDLKDVGPLVLNMVGLGLIENPLLTLDDVVTQCAIALAPQIGETPLTSKMLVREALSHWERVGLIERLNHADSTYLTFLHKTFAEFTAARYLIENRDLLSEHMLSSPNWREVITFATELGLADEVIKLRQHMHGTGAVAQLQASLALLSNCDAVVSDDVAQDLVQYAFEAIDNDDREKYSFGVALSDLATRNPVFVQHAAILRLYSANHQVRLIAWGIIVRCWTQTPHSSVMTCVLRDLIPRRDITSSYERILKKNDLSDRELIQLIAFAAFETQSDEDIEKFVKELEDAKIVTLDLRLKINRILVARGFEAQNWWPPEDDSRAAGVTLTPLGPGWRDASRHVHRLIAIAVMGKADAGSLPTRHNCFPNFAALLAAFGLGNCPVSDLYNWLSDQKPQAVASVMHAVVSVSPIDAEALRGEARDLVSRLDADQALSAYELLPHVDVPAPDWRKFESTSVDLEGLKEALFHSSQWLAKVAMEILNHVPMEHWELMMLMNQGTGHSLNCISELVLTHAPEQAPQMLVQRLESGLEGEISILFELLKKLRVEPTSKLIELTNSCLTSASLSTASAALGLFGLWADHGVALDVSPVAKAWEHWCALEDANAIIPNEIVHELTELLKKLRTQTVSPEPYGS